MARVYFLLVAVWLGVTHAQRNPDVCSINQQSGPAAPRLPRSWSSRMEVTDQLTKITRTAQVHYSYELNAASIWYKGFYEEWEGRLYLYNTSEYIAFVYTTSDCNVRPIGPDSIFGLEYVNGRAHIAPTERVLKFGDGVNPTTYVGPKVIRGINTNQWSSCVYDASKRSTAQMYWDMANPERSSVGFFNESVPVRMTERGKSINEAGRAIDFNTIYNFFDFTYDMEPAVENFQIPRGIYCKGMRNTKTKPMPRNAFKMRQESIETTMKVSASMSEWYDFSLKLLRFDFKPVYGSKFGFNPLKMIHDFNTGVAYVIDHERGNCSAMPISQSTMVDAKTEKERNLVRIKTVSELFFENLDYTYVGTRYIRGIKCDTWNAKVFRPKSNSTYIYEWHFTSGDWADGSSGRKFQRGAPVMLETFIQEYNFPIIYHFYDYVEEEPDVWRYNIGPCYNTLRRIDYRFTLPGSYKELVEPNPTRFKYYVLDAIMKNTRGVSPLRVNDIQVTAADNGRQMTVQFNLLDAAPVKGDKVKDARPEVSLDQASGTLNRAIRDYKFIVYFKPDPNNENNVIELSAIPNTLSVSGVRVGQISGTSGGSGYSPGAMAALALGMIILGLVLGTGVAYWFYFIKV